MAIIGKQANWIDDSEPIIAGKI
jgi:hypothetical protein